MFKPRHATTPSSRSFPTEVEPLELSFSELAMILGGQSQPDRGQELLDQFGRTGETFINEYVAPLLRVADEGYKLGVAVENYARWAVEYQESRELSEERGRQLDAEQREAEEEKQ